MERKEKILSSRKEMIGMAMFFLVCAIVLFCLPFVFPGKMNAEKISTLFSAGELCGFGFFVAFIALLAANSALRKIKHDEKKEP